MTMPARHATREISRNRLARLLPLAILCFALAHLPQAHAEDACVLRVGWDPYEPYSYTAADAAAPVGFDIDVVSQVARATGCALTFEKLAWSEILAELAAGRIDVTVGTGYKRERTAWSWYSEPYRKEVVGLLVRAGTAAEFPGIDLEHVLRRGLVFGKTSGDSYDADTGAAFAKYPGQVLAPVTEEENVERLLDATIDGFLIEINVAAALMRRMGNGRRLEFHPLSLEAGDYRLQMSRKTVPPELALRMNAAIQELRANGWLASAMQPYGVRQ